MQIRILAVGDVVGPSASALLSKKLWSLRNEYGVHMAVVNAENACVGNGLDAPTAKALFSGGADVLTSGNHIWHKKDIKDYLRQNDHLLRPCNYPPECPGSGYTTVNIDGYRVLVMNVLGTIFMEALECPFRSVEKILRREEGSYDLALLDVHAEATSEKLAIARYFDGKINVVWGTHTHTQTSDTRVLPGGTGFITDLGMTGPDNSILGIKNEIIIEKLTQKMPVRFEIADGNIEMDAAIFTVDTDSGKTLSVEGIRRQLN
ncbi:MAG: TIGR00282 family metallophosphoesterase [Eubacteriales bacterium]